MICESCEGEGYVCGKDDANPGALVILPCLDCMGSGIASCCDAAGSTPAPCYTPSSSVLDVEKARCDPLSPTKNPLVADEAGDLDATLGERMSREDHGKVEQHCPKGVQNLPHDAPPLVCDGKAGVLASTANPVNEWWTESARHRMLFTDSGAKASYRDDTFEARKCDYCGELYRGPAVYCSMRCALADA